MARRPVDKPYRGLRQLLAGQAHLSASEYATLLGLTVLVALITVMMISGAVGGSIRRSAVGPPAAGGVTQQLPHDAADNASLIVHGAEREK